MCKTDAKNINESFTMYNKKSTRIIKVEKKNKLVNIILVAAILFVVFISLPVLCQSHLESEEPASFKYSREANENFIRTSQKNHHKHDDNHGEHKHQLKSENKNMKKIPLDMTKIWIHSIGSTFIISAAPFFLLYVIPLDNSESMKPRLKILLAFASGGLLGDAFLHLIPHASHSHSHHHEHNKEQSMHSHKESSIHAHEHDDHSHWHEDNDHSHHGHDMTIGMWILGGIFAFLVVDKLVRILKGTTGHGHSHDEKEKKISLINKNTKENEKPTTSSNQQLKKKDEKENQKNDVDNLKETKNDENDVEISGYLNLAADFAHNFTDGLAIGASYLAGNSIGIITTVTILLHEVPHEIGDFAILIKAGCTKKKAMMLQLVTAIGALAGTCLALFGAADSEVIPTWVMPFTAGGFIYIATVSVLPELLEGSTKLGQSLKEIAALLAGVIIMVFIAMYE